jgi:hypothetical protein
MKPEDLTITLLGAAAALEQPNLHRADLGDAVQFTITQGTVRAMFPITGGEAQGLTAQRALLPAEQT